MILIYISLIISYVEHLFMYLLATYISSLEKKYLFGFSDHSLNKIIFATELYEFLKDFGWYPILDV